MKNYERLITDDIFMRLQNSQKQKGIFDILGQTHTEHWHSAFVCWLLSPDANHELYSFALNRLLSLYICKLEDLSNRYCTKLTIDDILDNDFNDLSFRTEYKVNGICQGAVDILGKNDKYTIIIENKVDATENFSTVNGEKISQTTNYHRYFENSKNYKNTKKIYIYLSANNTNPDDKHFMTITYQEFFDNVIIKCLKNPELTDEAKYLIEQYVCNLRKKSTITKQALALPAKDDCEELYKKYKEELMNIFECVKKHENIDAVEFKLYQRYKSVFDEIYLSCVRMTPDVKLKGKALVKYLVMTNKISVNDEFYGKYKDCIFEADLKEDNGNYYFIVGVKDDWALLDPSTTDEFAHYSSFSEAAEAIQREWNRINNIEMKVSCSGTEFWHLNDIKGPTPNDLK